MIEEAYVSFDVAELLKEKGFDEPIRCWYDNFQDFHEEGVRMSNSDCLPPSVMCPTQQMAVAWLREVHKLHICIEYDHPKFVSDIFKMDVIDEHGCAEHVSPTFANCRTYEEAIDAALEYTLENLI